LIYEKHCLSYFKCHYTKCYSIGRLIKYNKQYCFNIMFKNMTIIYYYMYVYWYLVISDIWTCNPGSGVAKLPIRHAVSICTIFWKIHGKIEIWIVTFFQIKHCYNYLLKTLLIPVYYLPTFTFTKILLTIL